MRLFPASSKILPIFVVSFAAVYAENIRYKVVSHLPRNHTAGVMVDDQVYPLKVQDVSSLYFIGNAPIAHHGYRYVILDQENRVTEQENFIRAPVTETNTYNEFYNRSWNSISLPQVPKILDPLPIVNPKKSDLHIDGQISTLHITGDQKEIDNMHADPAGKSKTSVKITYISLNDVKKFTKTSIAISGHSTRKDAKLSYKIKINKNDGDLYTYRNFKLRAMSRDPSYLREELAYDFASKMGLPAPHTSYIRLYFNDQAIGLFSLMETFKNPWARNEFANGKKYKHGAIFVTDINLGASVHITKNIPKITDTNNFPQNFSSYIASNFWGQSSDLSYIGENITLYEAAYSLKEKPSKGPANYKKLRELTKFIAQQPNNTEVKNSNAKAWENILDVESVLRTLAHEILISNVDGYCGLGNNYLLYDDIENDRIVMSGQDFDLTMGIIANDEFVTGNYEKYFGLSRRPLTSKILKVPKFKRRFEEIMHVAMNLINPDILFPRIDSLSTLLIQDVEWDKYLPRVSNSSVDYTAFVPFSAAVNGSFSDVFSSNSTVAGLSAKLGIRSLFLKEWVTLRSDNLLNFFKKTGESK